MKTSTKQVKRPTRGGSRDRNVWLAAAMIIAFNALLVAWVLLQPAGPRVSPIVSNVAGFVGPLLVLPMCFGALRQTTSQRWAPVLLGTGILSYAIGQVTFTWYVWALNQPPPMPSYATIGFQGQYPFLLLGILLLLPARATPGASRLRVALDGLMIMTAVVTFSWYFFLGPVVRQGEQTVLAKVLAVSYPLADIVLVASLLVLALRPSGRALKRALPLLAFGLVLIVITDGSGHQARAPGSGTVASGAGGRFAGRRRNVATGRRPWCSRALS